MRKPEYIFIHHTAISYTKNPDQWKATENYHKGKGWGAGGYNYEIAANGSVHQFRKDGSVTAAQYQENMNDGRAISICLDGNFDSEDPTPQQMVAVRKLVGEKMLQYGIPAKNILPHRKVAPKTCPGKIIPDDLVKYFKIEPITILNIPEWMASAVSKAKGKGIDVTNIDKELTVAELESLLYDLKVLSTKAGTLTKGRALVLLEKLHIL